MLYACSPVIDADEVFANACGCTLDPNNEDDVALVDEAIAAASDALTILSGHRFTGPCAHIDRPCRECCRHECCCTCELDRLPLVTPIVSIDAVLIDGDTVDPDTYAIENGRYLVRVGTDQARRPRWPGCQRLWLPSTELHTFEVQYTSGTPVGFIESSAGLELVCDLLAGCKPSSKRQVLRGVTQVSGAGVSAAVSDDPEVAKGLPAVARFVAFWNPAGTKVASAAWSPELEDGWSHHSFS